MPVTATSRRKRVLVNSTHIARVGGRFALAAFQLTPPLGRSMMIEVAGWPSAPPYNVNGTADSIQNVRCCLAFSKLCKLVTNVIDRVDDEVRFGGEGGHRQSLEGTRNPRWRLINARYLGVYAETKTKNKSTNSSNTG